MFQPPSLFENSLPLPLALLINHEEKHTESIIEVLKKDELDAGVSPKKWVEDTVGRAHISRTLKEVTVDLARFAEKDSSY